MEKIEKILIEDLNRSSENLVYLSILTEYEEDRSYNFFNIDFEKLKKENNLDGLIINEAKIYNWLNNYTVTDGDFWWLE